MDPLVLHMIWTVISFVFFVGIIVWAYSSKRKSTFDAAAQLPLEDDEFVQARAEGRKHG